VSTETAGGIGGRWRALRTRLRGWRPLPWLLRESGPPPRPSRWAWAADGALAVGLALVTVYAVVASAGGDLPQKVVPRDAVLPRGVLVPMAPDPPPPDRFVVEHATIGFWAVVVAVLVGLPLVARRRFPLGAFWMVTAAALLFRGGPTLDGTAVLVSCLVAAYSVAMYSPYRALAVASLLCGGALVAGIKHDLVVNQHGALLPLLLLLPLGLVANAVHTWKQRVRSLEVDREAAGRLATERERARIARELHDVVTHNVSVMVVQAGAARTVLDAAPDRAREAMKAVESTGRAALSELRHAMGLLTMTEDQPAPDGEGELAGPGGPDGTAGPDGPDGSDAVELAPQPGLAELPALVDRMRGTGMPVELSVTGTPGLLSPGVDLTAYRVAQEALTNAVKHASGAAVRITVEHRPDAVRLEVADTGGTATAPARLGNGRGLLGLRERLALYGGSLQTGPRPTGGFRVRAEIPVEAVEPVQPTAPAEPAEPVELL
jgi:signal transduction histidine kinase